MGRSEGEIEEEGRILDRGPSDVGDGLRGQAVEHIEGPVVGRHVTDRYRGPRRAHPRLVRIPGQAVAAHIRVRVLNDVAVRTEELVEAVVDGPPRDPAAQVMAAVDEGLLFLGQHGKRHPDVPLADRRGPIAVRPQHPADGRRPRPDERPREVFPQHARPEARAPAVPPGQQRIARRGADGRRRVRVGETHPRTGDAVDVGGGEPGFGAHRPHVAPTEIVRQDDDDVGPRSGRGIRGRLHRGERLPAGGAQERPREAEDGATTHRAGTSAAQTQAAAGTRRAGFQC